jgi:predicted carbohydrate-binding protein with CBM5 and CBM33 domain
MLWATTLLVVAVLLSAAGVQAHGYVTYPKSRQVDNNNDGDGPEWNM